MTKIEAIKNRKLSTHDRKALEFMAAKSGDAVTGKPEGNIPDGLEDQMPAPPQDIKTNPPGSIEAIVRHYFTGFRADYESNISCALTNAAMQLEAAALITKAIRESRQEKVK